MFSCEKEVTYSSVMQVCAVTAAVEMRWRNRAGILYCNGTCMVRACAVAGYLRTQLSIRRLLLRPANQQPATASFRRLQIHSNG